MRGCASGLDSWRADSTDGLNALPNQIHGHCRQPVDLFVGEPDNDFCICGLSEARCTEALPKRDNSVVDESRLPWMQKSDPPVSRLLSVHQKWPCAPSPNDQFDETPPPHMTSRPLACAITAS